MNKPRENIMHLFSICIVLGMGVNWRGYLISWKLHLPPYLVVQLKKSSSVLILFDFANLSWFQKKLGSKERTKAVGMGCFLLISRLIYYQLSLSLNSLSKFRMACLLGHFILSLGFAPGNGMGKNFYTSLICHRINAYFLLLNFYTLSSDMKQKLSLLCSRAKQRTSVYAAVLSAC